MDRRRTSQDHGSFDSFAEAYDRYSTLEPPTVRDWLLPRLARRGRCAFDAGCGSGRHALTLADRFERVVAVDISHPLIEIARRRRHHPRVDYRMESLLDTAQPGGFDLVFSAFTLHHVPDLDRALVHLRELVAVDGMAILIDSVAPRPTPPRSVNLAGAIREIPVDLRRHGRRDARWLVRFRTSKPWLDHLAGDRYLSRRAFGERYGAVFPGAEFHVVGHGLGLVWRKSRELGRTAAGAS